MFANNSFRGYSPELEMTGSFPKIEISRISHGSDLRSKKKTRYPAGKSTLAQNFCQWASFSTPTGISQHLSGLERAGPAAEPISDYPTNQLVCHNYDGFLRCLLGFERLGMASAKYH
jgi:hypothetical protein